MNLMLFKTKLCFSPSTFIHTTSFWVPLHFCFTHKHTLSLSISLSLSLSLFPPISLCSFSLNCKQFYSNFLLLCLQKNENWSFVKISELLCHCQDQNWISRFSMKRISLKNISLICVLKVECIREQSGYKQSCSDLIWEENQSWVFFLKTGCIRVIFRTECITVIFESLLTTLTWVIFL